MYIEQSPELAEKELGNGCLERFFQNKSQLEKLSILHNLPMAGKNLNNFSFPNLLDFFQFSQSERINKYAHLVHSL